MFPVEIKKEITQYLPQYPRLSKDIYDPNLFYNYQCDLPISPNEVLNYFKTKPLNVTFFYKERFSFIIDRFNLFEGTSSYQRYRIVIAPFYTDVSRLYETANETFVRIKSIKNTINSIYTDNIVEIDLNSTFAILNQRSACLRVNPDYAIEKIRHIIERYLVPVSINGILSFLKWIEKIMYLYYNNLADYPYYYRRILFYDDDTPVDVLELDMIKSVNIDYDQIASYYN